LYYKSEEARAMAILMSVDLGTTGLKVALVNESGTVLSAEYCEYTIESPKLGYAEQDSEHWWHSFIMACKKLKQQMPKEFSQIDGIGICGQMHTHVYLDSDDTPLGRAITWMDQRSSGIVDEINSDAEALDFIFSETKNFATPTYTAPNVRWVKENRADLWDMTKHILIAKDYLKFKLTDAMVTDFSDASGTLLFDVEKRTWSEGMFEYFGIPRSFFPKALPSDEVIGSVSKEAEELTGIKAGTPVVNGSSDKSAAALGAGMVKSGQVTLIIGTAGVITVCSDRPLIDPQRRTLCWNYCLRDRWAVLGITQTAGESLNWFRNAFDAKQEGYRPGSDIFDEYNETIRDIPDGSEGLIFLPYLCGERTPCWDSFARGVFYGINLCSKKAHFIKAVMEGVSFALRHCMETVESLGIHIDEIRAVGGGIKSPVWLNTLGKILKKPIRTVETTDAALIGNMVLSSKALGFIDTVEESVEKVVEYGQKIFYAQPNDIYEKQYEIYKKLYADLKETFLYSFQKE
jgi:xylulokinase